MEKEWFFDMDNAGNKIIVIEGIETREEAREIAHNVEGDTFYAPSCAWCVFFYPTWSNDYSGATNGIVPANISQYA